VDTAIVNVAAPSIRSGFGASDGQVTLVVSSYIVVFAVLLVTGARLGSTHGHRRMFLWGLAVFTAASLACGLASGVIALIVARFVQGAGAALMVPQVLSGIQLHFTGPGRTKALGWYAIALSGGAVAGQVLGGLLISANLFGTTWRPIFLINVVLGAAIFSGARRFLPADDVRERQRMDVAGVVALSAAVLLVIMPLVLGRDQAWPLWTVGCLVASVPVFGWFIVVERRVAARGGRPLVAAAVLRNVVVRNGLLAHGLTSMTYCAVRYQSDHSHGYPACVATVTCCSGSAYFWSDWYLALLFVLALYLQRGLGAGPAYSGLAMVCWVAAFGLAGPLLPRVPPRYRALAPVAGCLILALGYTTVWVYLLAGGRTGPLLFLLLGIGGLGLGISANSLINAMTSALPDRFAADLSGVITTNAQLCGALAVAVAGTGYLGLRTGPSGAFTVVLIAFTVVALLGAVAARKTVSRPGRHTSHPNTGGSPDVTESSLYC
jgi:MFS family permease